MVGARGDGELPFPHRRVRQREVAALAASGRHRAVVVSTGGRLALPAPGPALAARGCPLILWTSLWAHPRSAAHALSYPALRRLYRSAEAIVTYGTARQRLCARARRAQRPRRSAVGRQRVLVATRSPLPARALPRRRWPSQAAVKFLFAGRPVREKGLGVLIEAWLDSGLVAPAAALVLVGVGSSPPWVPAGGAVRTRWSAWIPSHPCSCADMYAAADVLVVPSIPTRTFREPWGLVVNEAMNRNLPVIASDAVGAVAGGLVRDGHNGLVVPAGDARALARALRPARRRRTAARPSRRSRARTTFRPTPTTPGRKASRARLPASGSPARLTPSVFPARRARTVFTVGGAGSVRHLPTTRIAPLRLAFAVAAALALAARRRRTRGRERGHQDP